MPNPTDFEEVQDANILSETQNTSVTPTEPSDAAAPPAAPKSLRDELSLAYDKSSKSPTEGDPPKPGATTPTPSNAEQPVVKDPAAVLDQERPVPERLKAKFGEKWKDIPQEFRSAFHEYETDIGRMANKFGRAAKSWNDLDQAAAPYQEMIRSEGGTIQTAVVNLLETSRILRYGSPEQKAHLIQQTCQAFNIPLPGGSQLSPQPANGGQPAPSPQPSGMSPALLDRFNRIEQQLLTRDATEMHNVRTQVDSDIQTFISDPANVYVKEPGYLDTMAALIQSGKASDLPDAYKQAAWLYDGPRAVEISKVTASRNATRIDQATRARAAGVSVNGNAPGNVKLDPSKLSLRDTLSAAYDGELE